MDSHVGAFPQRAKSLVKLNVHDGMASLHCQTPTGCLEGTTEHFFDIVFYGYARRDYVAIWNGLYDGLGAQLSGSSPFVHRLTRLLLLLFPPGLYINDYVGIA